MNEQDLRDCFAMFAMNGILGMLKGGNEGLITVQESVSKYSYEFADAMLEARKPKDVGIKTVKRTGRSK
jgi:hypothetical protein